MASGHKEKTHVCVTEPLMQQRVSDREANDAKFKRFNFSLTMAFTSLRAEIYSIQAAFKPSL